MTTGPSPGTPPPDAAPPAQPAASPAAYSAHAHIPPVRGRVSPAAIVATVLVAVLLMAGSGVLFAVLLTRARAVPAATGKPSDEPAPTRQPSAAPEAATPRPSLVPDDAPLRTPDGEAARAVAVGQGISLRVDPHWTVSKRLSNGVILDGSYEHSPIAFVTVSTGIRGADGLATSSIEDILGDDAGSADCGRPVRGAQFEGRLRYASIACRATMTTQQGARDVVLFSVATVRGVDGLAYEWLLVASDEKAYATYSADVESMWASLDRSLHDAPRTA